MTFNLYISKEFQSFVDQLIFVASSNKTSESREICKAIKYYIQNLNNEKSLVAEKEDWDKFLKEASKEEIYEMSRVICGINDRLVRKVMSQ